MSQPALDELLTKGLSQLGQSLSADQQQKLLTYVALLAKWNKAYNLTAVRKPDLMVTRHVLDSLVVAPYIYGEEILDVGTGAGLPGIPLAVVLPAKHFTLLDSNNKKTRFVQQAVAELELTNVNVVHSRVEEFRPTTGFDTIVSRAYSSIREMLLQTQHLATNRSKFFAMKGIYPQVELDDLPSGFELEACYKLDVPGLDAERHLLIIKASA